MRAGKFSTKSHGGSHRRNKTTGISGLPSSAPIVDACERTRNGGPHSDCRGRGFIGNVNLKSTALRRCTGRSRPSVTSSLPTPSVRVCSRRVRMPSVRDMHPRARQRVGGAAARSGIAGAMKPASRLELSRGPLAAPLEGIIVGSSNIGDTKGHAARCGVASTAGAHNSFHDALRQGQRVVDIHVQGTDRPRHSHARACAATAR